jgi:malate dehydrogenase (oxaloacetate-decarboxylating)
MAIHEDKSKAFQFTIKRNSVAVISDGSAVLGLGNIGPHAAMPVMEGKDLLFKQLADVDAYPICLTSQDTDEIVSTNLESGSGYSGTRSQDSFLKFLRCEILHELHS